MAVNHVVCAVMGAAVPGCRLGFLPGSWQLCLVGVFGVVGQVTWTSLCRSAWDSDAKP